MKRATQRTGVFEQAILRVSPVLALIEMNATSDHKGQGAGVDKISLLITVRIHHSLPIKSGDHHRYSESIASSTAH